MKIILILIALFILYIIYATIRMAIDPEYRDKVEQETNRQKSRRHSSNRYHYWYNKSHDHIHGMFKYSKRDTYARRQADKELRKYIKSIK